MMNIRRSNRPARRLSGLGYTFDPSTDSGPDLMTISPDYSSSLETIAPGIVPIVQSTQTNGEAWTDALARTLPIVAATTQQAMLLGVQADRAKKGLPPLDVSQYAAGVQVGLSSDTKSMIMMIAGGLGLLLLLKR